MAAIPCECVYIDVSKEHITSILSAKACIPTHKSTRRHNRQDHHRHIHRRENLKSLQLCLTQLHFSLSLSLFEVDFFVLSVPNPYVSVVLR
jgi:hypothetical protein